MNNQEFITPPNHVNFLAKKLYGEGKMIDVSIAYAEKDGGGPIQNHTHPHNHLFIVTKGEAKIMLEDKIVVLKENQSFLVEGKIPHSCWNNIDEETTIVGISLMPQ